MFSKIMINFLNDFEQERPACQPWSLVPILCVLVGLMTLIAIAFLAKYINKTQNKKLLNGIILIYGLLFLGLEIYHEINRYFFFGYYDFSSIPFQFCSIPIYLCLILPFIKSEKIRMPIFYYLGIYCMIAGIFPLLFGQGQLCRWGKISDVIRSFLWHVLILQVSILSVVHTEIGKNIKKDYKYFLGAVAIFVGLTVRSTNQCDTALHRRHQLQTDRRKTVQRCHEHSIVRSRCRFLFLHFSLLRFQYACLF